jgi:nucleotide-binding universal stress UspA family protein
VEQEVTADVAIPRICQVVGEEDADLVVIGSEGADGLEEFLVGSDAEEVVRQCECPVLTIKQKIDHFEVRSILFPSDFTAEAEVVLPYLRFYQEFFAAHINLLYVRTKNDKATDPEIHERMQAFVDRYQLTNVNLIIQPSASASGGIIATSTEMNYDLILMPTHGRSGFAQLFNKSIAESVVNHASIPVLTFHWPTENT